MLNINLADYIDGNPEEKFKGKILKCPDKNAYLEYSVKATRINTEAAADTMSMMSGMDNIDLDSNPDSEF